MDSINRYFIGIKRMNGDLLVVNFNQIAYVDVAEDRIIMSSGDRIKPTKASMERVKRVLNCDGWSIE